MAVTEVGSDESYHDDREQKAGDPGDDGRNPLGPSERVPGFDLFEVEVDLLQDIFGLE